MFKPKYFKIFILCALYLVISHNSLFAQIGQIRWMRIGALRSFFSEQGQELESARPGRLTICDGMAWPAEYGMEQSTIASRGLFIGCRNFNDPVMNRTYDYKVVARGPRDDTSWESQIFPIELKMIGRFRHPTVYVDEQTATANELYDIVDEVDPDLPADRMIIVRFNTSLGISVTKKILAFSQQYHDNYFVYDWVFKNTGIVDAEGNKFPQTLEKVYFGFIYRYAFSGEGCTGYDQGWAEWDETWGENNVNHAFGTDPTASDFKFRAQYAYYGRSETRPNTHPDWDWGLPNNEANLDDEIMDESMAAAKFVGCVTLHADKSTEDKSDDPYQPVSTPWKFGDSSTNGSDHAIVQANIGQYDEQIMQQRWDFMASGHPEQTQMEFVADRYPVYTSLPDHGGYSQAHAFGPYTLKVGDSIRIIVAEGIAGINRAKNREVTRNWLMYEQSRPNLPELVRPNGQTTTDHHLYKKEWFWSCRDSLLQTFERAIEAYHNDYNLLQPPPPPAVFNVTPGGNLIRLSWSEEAMSDPHFDGYEIWRAVGLVDKPTSVYVKIFECNKANVVHTFDDTTARRGTDNYYYIVSKDDGSQNTIQPGVPLVSSKQYTLTNVAARLKRPQGEQLEDIRIVPNPFIIDRQVLTQDKPRDQISMYELPPKCKISIFTERGDLVWDKIHDDGSGDDYWYSLTSSGQLVASGIYIVLFEVLEDYTDAKGVLVTKGTNTFRKLIIIR